jgi:hypothetical protein
MRDNFAKQPMAFPGRSGISYNNDMPLLHQ